MGDARFVEAVGAGEPWLDNPYLPSGSKNLPLRGLTDLGATESTGVGRDAQLDVKAALEIRRRPGALVSVDGVVHRSCSVPRVHLVQERQASGAPWRWRLAWMAGPGFEAVSGQETMRAPPHAARWSGIDRLVGFAKWPDLPVTMAEQSLSLARGYLDGMRRSGGGDEGVWSLDDDLGIEVVRPDLTPVDPAIAWWNALVQDGAMDAASGMTDAILSALARRDAGELSRLAQVVGASRDVRPSGAPASEAQDARLLLGLVLGHAATTVVLEASDDPVEGLTL